jgi:hypothetical protein
MSRKLKLKKMKKVLKPLFLLFLGGVLFASCKNAGKSSTETSMDSSSTTTKVQKMDYPYTITHPDYWETGSQQNTMNVLKALKAYENKNIDESLSYFGDSVRIAFDGIDKKVSKDTLKVLFSPDPKILKHSIKMNDWESVISSDKKDEYVTIWYRQYTETAKGKDSLDVVNDFKMKDGKIIELTEYQRKLHK